MEAGKILSTKNIPDSVKVGFSTMAVLECASKDIYRKLEQDLRGVIFHLEKDGRFFVAIPNSIAKTLSQIIEN